MPPRLSLTCNAKRHCQLRPFPSLANQTVLNYRPRPVCITAPALVSSILAICCQGEAIRLFVSASGNILEQRLYWAIDHDPVYITAQGTSQFYIGNLLSRRANWSVRVSKHFVNGTILIQSFVSWMDSPCRPRVIRGPPVGQARSSPYKSNVREWVSH